VVIGIVRAVEGGVRMFDFNRPDVFLPIARDAAGTSLMVRANGDPAHVRLALLERLTRIDPAFDDISTLRTMAGLGEYLLRLAFWVAVVVGGLALLLTVSGLFGVLSYLVEQRRQEIGVRMALGASSGEVVRFVVGQSLGPVAFGLAVGAGLAGTLATVLMATPAASQIKGVVHVFDPIAYASSLLVILSACTLAATLPARRAAGIDPMKTLRQE
jgi:predicted lysophospholipase L1 biosynthesis ABC-type transport system permease subunit